MFSHKYHRKIGAAEKNTLFYIFLLTIYIDIVALVCLDPLHFFCLRADRMRTRQDRCVRNKSRHTRERTRNTTHTYCCRWQNCGKKKLTLVVIAVQNCC